jgi:hypothetical protein
MLIHKATGSISLVAVVTVVVVVVVYSNLRHYSSSQMCLMKQGNSFSMVVSNYEVAVEVMHACFRSRRQMCISDGRQM